MGNDDNDAAYDDGWWDDGFTDYVASTVKPGDWLFLTTAAVAASMLLVVLPITKWCLRFRKRARRQRVRKELLEHNSSSADSTESLFTKKKKKSEVEMQQFKTEGSYTPPQIIIHDATNTTESCQQQQQQQQQEADLNASSSSSASRDLLVQDDDLPRDPSGESCHNNDDEEALNSEVKQGRSESVDSHPSVSAEEEDTETVDSGQEVHDGTGGDSNVRSSTGQGSPQPDKAEPSETNSTGMTDEIPHHSDAAPVGTPTRRHDPPGSEPMYCESGAEPSVEPEGRQTVVARDPPPSPPGDLDYLLQDLLDDDDDAVEEEEPPPKDHDEERNGESSGGSESNDKEEENEAEKATENEAQNETENDELHEKPEESSEESTEEVAKQESNEAPNEEPLNETSNQEVPQESNEKEQVCTNENRGGLTDNNYVLMEEQSHSLEPVLLSKATKLLAAQQQFEELAEGRRCCASFWRIVKMDRESRRIMRYTIPFTFYAVAETVMESVTLALVGHFIGTKQVAAYAIVEVLVSLTDEFLDGPFHALTTLCAHAVGADNCFLAGQYVQISVILYILTSIPITVGWFLYTDWVILYLGWGNEEVAEHARGFVQIAIWSSYTSALHHCIAQLLEVVGHEMVTTLIGLVEGGVALGLIVLVIWMPEYTLTLEIVAAIEVVTSFVFLVITMIVAGCMGWLRPFRGGLFLSNSLCVSAETCLHRLIQLR